MEPIEQQPSSPQHPGIDHVLTMEALRALAHPLRVRIYDELSAYGPLTASGLAARLGESSGSTSYHLRQLEKHGLVREDVGRGDRRDRWWERSPGSIATPDAYTLPPGSADRLAAQLVDEEWMRARRASLEEFLAQGESVFDRVWLDATSFDTINLRLTPEQLHGLMSGIDAVLREYIDAYKTTPTPGSRPVQLQVNAFPLVRGEVTPEGE
ncbi:winged helix-turn-helix domain-containing protein [Protaetiibacter intestinalis]|uniref:ArsR family transcriptional regulator n=1 Tax=Protaetiibacter intestinalis TaxID=2419774 RepID=A0A387B6E2_9MICO|nr:helix-turn-helix domain-containing protein [Protaetiibacter intestinalis]AYF97917.1 ArsR family transcriptional regulator [Protaetiibacter intestinalis]